MRRRLACAIAVLSVLTTLSACSGDEGSTELETVEVTVEDGAVTPAGDRIEVDADQPVDLVVTSDVAGEIHVHSSPEQYFPFEAGANEPISLQFSRPGVVDVELHEPFEGPVLSLEVK